MEAFIYFWFHLFFLLTILVQNYAFVYFVNFRISAKISFSILGDMEMHKSLWKCITETNVMENI